MKSDLIEISLRLENITLSKYLIERVLFWSEELEKNKNMKLSYALALNKKTDSEE